MKNWIGAIVLALGASVWAAPGWTQARITKIEPEKAWVTAEMNNHLVIDQMEPAE